MRHVAPLVPIALALLQCGGAPDAGGQLERIGHDQAAIHNGVVVSDAYSGTVALEAWSSQINSWLTVCSGTLMTNDKVLTDAACLRAPPTVVFMGNQWQWIASSISSGSSDVDVGVVKLAGPLTMWNWHGDHYVGSPALTTGDFQRLVYSGTDASLDGVSLACFGWGNGGLYWVNPQPPLTAAFLPFTDSGRGYLNASQNTSLQQLEFGDNGAGCFPYGPGFPPVAFVATSFNGNGWVSGPGAQDFGLWVAIAMAFLG